MIKTLRITSVVAAILAGVLIKFFVLPMVTNVAGDPEVEKLLDSPDAIEQFKETKGAHAKSAGSKTSPLVQQATAFAQYLNPPPKVSPSRTGGRTTTGIKTTLPPTTPKFRVFATTYFEGNPSLSQALIDEPGKGRHWVRQASMVNHLLIEEVRDGVVVVKNSADETFELEVEQSSKTSLPTAKPATSKATSTSSSYRRSSSTPTRTTAGSARTSSAKTPSTTTSSATRTPSRTAGPSSSEISSEKADKLVNTLRALQRSTRSDKTSSGLSGEERAARIEELIQKFRSSEADSGDAKNATSGPGEKSAESAKDPNRISVGPEQGNTQPGTAKPGASKTK